MLKLASKFAMDIFPSVIATILGAYIVNHYINTKPAADAPTAAAVSTAEPKKAVSRADSKPAEKSADLANIPEPGVRAKGIPEKAIIDKSAAEKPVDKADRPSETASIPPVVPAETRRHQPTRDKPVAKAAPAAEPVTATPATTALAEPPAAATPDANDLARAAIERLRGSEPSSRAQESARPAETPRVVTAPATSVASPPANTPSLQPLPPPILVSTPPTDSKPTHSSANPAEDPQRPTPPADIPDPAVGPPLDLRADATEAPKRKTSVADDVLSAAKSMFHSVLPK